MPTSRRRRLTTWGLAILAVAACAGDRAFAPETATPVFIIAPGFVDNQSVPVGAPYPQPVGAQVTGISGVNGQIVNFVVTSGGGSVFAGAVASAKPSSGLYAGKNGVAQTQWTLGPTAGPQTVEARLVNPATGATITTAVFHAIGLAGPAALIKPATGDQQAAVAGTAVAVPPAALVTDQFGNPIAGVQVTFAVARGGGSVIGASQVTASDGTARVGDWILGPATGANILTATAAGLAGGPATFTAVGGVGTAARLVVAAGDRQVATVNTQLPIAPTFQAVDANGNGVQGVAVTFVASNGSTLEGDVQTIAMLTDLGGYARINWTIASIASFENSVRGISPGLAGSPAVMTATGIADAPARVWLITGDNQNALHGTAVPLRPTVEVVDRYGNPTAGVAVHYSVSGGGGSITGADPVTDQDGLAAVGSWTLGPVAGPQALMAAVSLPAIDGNPVTFTATAVSWQVLAGHSSHSRGAAATVSDRIFAMGAGFRPADRLDEYDPMTDTWHARASMPDQRTEFAAAAVNGLVYLVGGWSLSGDDMAFVAAYDPASDTWSPKARLHTGRQFLSAASVNGLLYVVGGWHLGRPDATLEVYDPTTDSWSTKSPMPTPRAAAAIGVVNGIIYVAGGWTDAGAVATLESYDPQTDVWTTNAPMPQALAELAAGVVHDTLYAVGGYEVGGGPVASVYAYDPIMDRWSAAVPLPGANYDMSVVVAGGLLYSIGGALCDTCLYSFLP